MSRKLAASLLTFLLLAVFVVLSNALVRVNAAPAAQHTVVFQQGLDGYSGVEDAWVSSNDWANPPQYSVNYGQNEALRLERDGGDNPLLRFDLSSIPANSEIISATLALYNTTDACYTGSCNALPVRHIKLPIFGQQTN